MTGNEVLPAVLRPRKAAPYIGVSLATLARMRGDGTGPSFVVLHNRCIGYARADLDAWSASRPKYRNTSERTVAGAAA